MDYIAHQAPLSMGFPRQEYWSGLPFLSSGDLPNPGIEPRSPTLRADALPSEPPGKQVSNHNGKIITGTLPKFFCVIVCFEENNSIFKNKNTGLPSGIVDKNPPANSRDTGLIPGPGKFHMPRSNLAHVPQILSPCAATTEACVPRARAPQQERSLQ